MFDYTCDSGSLGQSKHIWSRSPLQPFSDILTPFSYSVLAEISKQAWFGYYDRLDLDLPYVPNTIIRHYHGRPYLNIKWICQRDVELAGLAPLAFRVNGEEVAVCEWSKPNFLEGFRNNRIRKKMAVFLDTLSQEVDETITKARGWYRKVASMNGTQAEILQIMEEIERMGVESLMTFYAARHNLERQYNYLLRTTARQWPFPENLNQINNTLSDLQGLDELAVADELLVLSRLARESGETLAWLRSNDFIQWRTTLPDSEFGERVHHLMHHYGHWATGEGELANPRWTEDPTVIFKAVLACAEEHSKPPARVPSSQSVQNILNAVVPKERKAVHQRLESLSTLHLLQSKALSAFAYILAGTRVWAKAAAEEGRSDQRIRSLDEVFYFELEELKEMMTGEWNVNSMDEIHATARKRRVDYERWQQAQPGDLLFDDVEAYPTHEGLPGATGRATGPLRRQKTLHPILCEGAVVGASQLDSGWSPTLPVAGGFIAAAGTPLDPIVAAARVWHVPTVVSLGPHYDGLVNGAQTTLDGGSAEVEQ